MILGDSNAKVGHVSQVWEGVLGKHDVGKCNANVRLLLEIWSEHQLAITNAILQQRGTWTHPHSNYCHLLDYIFVRQKDQKDVLHIAEII